MQRLFLAAALLLACLLLGAPANANGYSGYFYPSGTGTTSCSPACYGVRATIQMPSPVYSGWNDESQNNSSIWIGLVGEGGHGLTGSGCSSPVTGGVTDILMQFGVNPFITKTGTVTFLTWHEQYPCNNLTNFGSLVINAGDTITLELLCTSNCTYGNTAAVWTMTWTNVTTGLFQSTTKTNFGIYGDHADIVIEPQSTAVNSTTNQPLHFTTPMKVSNVQIYQGGAWGPMSVPGEAPPSKIEYGSKQISNTSNPRGAPYNINVTHVYCVSAPIDSDKGPSFLIGSQIVQNSLATKPASGSCPYSNFSGAGGVGP